MLIHFLQKKKTISYFMFHISSTRFVRIASVFVCYCLVHVFAIRFVHYHFPNALALFFAECGTSGFHCHKAITTGFNRTTTLTSLQNHQTLSSRDKLQNSFSFSFFFVLGTSGRFEPWIKNHDPNLPLTTDELG